MLIQIVVAVKDISFINLLLKIRVNHFNYNIDILNYNIK